MRTGSQKKPYDCYSATEYQPANLHGHALDETLEDILIRWKRMQGYSALGSPGAAETGGGYAEEGISKEDIGRRLFWKSLGLEGEIRRPHLLSS